MSRFGQGEAPALLLHCSLGHSGGWGGVMAHLGGSLDALAPDLPGHGRSPAWQPEAGDLHDLATAQAAVLLDRPRHLLGHSFGATVALRLALEQPDKVLSLALIEPVLFGALPQGAMREGYRADHAGFYAALARGDTVAAARAFLRIWGDGRRWDSLPEAFRADVAARIHLIGAGAQALEHDRPGLLAPGRLEALDIPVLLVAGAASHPSIAAVQDALAPRFAHLARVVVPGAGHMVPITHPAPVAQALRAHLARAGVAGGKR